MKKSIALVAAALFATANLASFAYAAEKADKKPTKEECQKDPKLKGCEADKKK